MEKPDAETLKLLASLKKTNSPSEKVSIITQLMESNKVLPEVKEHLAKLLEEVQKTPFKTREDFMKEVILFHNAEKMSPDLTPEQRAEEVEKILNDPQTRHRIIFAHWPRPALGTSTAYITPDNTLPGKTAPNGLQLWGATLFDFYRVQRFPGIANVSTITTGSKMAAWCKANGEADFAPANSMIQWADEEEEPKIIEPTDIARLVTDGEYFVGDKTWNKDTEKEGEEGKDADMSKLPEEWPPKSIFDPAAYPKPWPSIPFNNDWPWVFQRLPTLQHYIPQSRLPRRLIVHDPWNLLHVCKPYDDEKWAKDIQIPWTEKKDIIHTYKLKLSEKNVDRRKKEDEEIAKEEARAKKVLETFLADPHSRNELPPGLDIRHEGGPGPACPPIYVILPPEPALASAEEAHLYLSPSQTIGKGHHSFVYFAEFEVPRSFIVKERLCTECIMDDVADILKQEEFRDPKWEEKSGKIFVKRVMINHPKVMTLEGKDDEYLLEEGCLEESLEYEGPYRVIHSRVKYQNLERGQYCEHFRKSPHMIHPLTTKVRVAAKLSIKHDPHLRREAENYQAFPKHFFEHWSGYNIIQPLHDPVPVAPIVPQFYGYYVVDEEEEKNKADAMDTTADTGSSSSRSRSGPTYLSPILLMERCGIPINPDELTADDKSEYASLVHRFNEARWYHGSIAQRNILIQAGPLSAWPLERMINGYARGGHGVNWSFRLIDFGRSLYVGGDEPGTSKGWLKDEQNQVTSWFNGWKGL